MTTERAAEGAAYVRDKVAERGWTREIEETAQKALNDVMFTPEQFWNGDLHLAAQVSAMAFHHLQHGHGHPQFVTETEWRGILTRIAAPLHKYATADDALHGAERDEITRSARAALHLFADWFDYFWD